MKYLSRMRPTGILSAVLCGSVVLVDPAMVLAETAGVSPAAAESSHGQVAVRMAPDSHTDLAEQWGVEIVGLRLTAAGYFLDFRYKILQPEKAVALMNREVKAKLLHHDSGAELPVPVPPKVGRLRQRSSLPKEGRHYFMLFANPGQLVQAGDEVTVVIGDFRAEHLIVEGRS